MAAEHRLNLSQLSFRIDCLWSLRHHLFDCDIEEAGLSTLNSTTYVAVGDDTYYLFVFNNDTKSEFTTRDSHNGFRQLQFGSDDWQILGVHHILHTQQQLTTQTATRMEHSKIVSFESAYLHQSTSDSVTHSDGCSGTACRSKVQRTCLMVHIYRDMIVGITCDERLRIACHRNNRYMTFLHRSYESEYLIRISRVGYEKQYIVGSNHTQIAVQGIERIDK